MMKNTDKAHVTKERLPGDGQVKRALEAQEEVSTEHARWVYDPQQDLWDCGSCGEATRQDPDGVMYAYCPHCGRKIERRCW